MRKEKIMVFSRLRNKKYPVFPAPPVTLPSANTKALGFPNPLRTHFRVKTGAHRQPAESEKKLKTIKLCHDLFMFLQLSAGETVER